MWMSIWSGVKSGHVNTCAINKTPEGNNFRNFYIYLFYISYKKKSSKNLRSLIISKYLCQIYSFYLQTY